MLYTEENQEEQWSHFKCSTVDTI